MNPMRGKIVYGLLVFVWFAVAGWQAFEHQRMRESGRRALSNRAHDLSAALSVVIRSQGRTAIVPRPRLEAALGELVDSTELESVTLLNESGEVAASAGRPMQADLDTLLRMRELWTKDRASFANLVALGPGAEKEPAILLLDGPRDRPRRGPQGEPGHPPGPGPGPPPWMNRREYDRLAEERGVHWFLVTIPTGPLRAAMARDLQLRGIVVGVALLACLALGAAWRAFERSSNLEIQLVRAGEAAQRLQELNVTAAGLVHETKNPLNLIRGWAQMIGHAELLPAALRDTALKITEEADRVTGRLNQFLDYARPVQPRPKPLPLSELVKGVFGILAFDQEEKSVSFDWKGPSLTVLADEDMLRQVLFNLILNAVQAVPDGGRVEVRAMKESAGTAAVEIHDNGPGVPEQVREEIFRPYFTTSENGTGLGLAVVRRIAHAHGWRVACVPDPSGGVFRVSGITLAQEQATFG